jgi:mannobiose 2-epimerase
VNTTTSDLVVRLYAEVRRHLEGGIVPFWLERAPDRRFGGFVTNFDSAGRALETPEKYLNTQAHLIWWFSRLFRKYPQQQLYAQIARDGVDFLSTCFWDKTHGGWFWKVRSDGTRLDDAKLVYGQSFAIYALSEYSLATGDPRGVELASETFDLLQKHCADTLRGGYFENLDSDWAVAADGASGGDRKSLDTHMHLMESFTVLYAASNRELHRRKLREIIDLITRYMIDPVALCGRNQFNLDFKPVPAITLARTWKAERQGAKPATPVDTTSYGHNLELIWLMHLALETSGADLRPYWELWSGVAQNALHYGVDWEYGGIYRDGNSRGPTILDKEFWQHAEALVGFLDAYELFGDDKYLEAFERIWNFVAEHMIVEEVGEWRTLLDRAGRPLDAGIGNPWKVAYHTGRAMIECTERLERIK